MLGIEMMVKTALENAAANLSKQLPELIENLSARLPAMLENLPPEIKNGIGQISETLLGFQSQLARIEAKQDLILSHLGISALEERDDGHGTKQREQ